MPAPVDPTQLYGSRPAPSTRLPTGAAAPEAVDISDLNFLLNAGPSSKRSARAAAQEEHKKVLPPPTGNELRVMSVQQAVDALIEHVNVDSVVRGCCERWQALGYGPGRRQSAAEAGALAAIVGGMRAHPSKPLVQEKACLAIANICSGTDDAGLARKATAFEAGAVEAIVEALKAHPTDKAVQSNGSAAMGNICYAADYAGLRRKQAAYSAGAIDPIVGALAQYTDDTSVCENGAFALGNLCRALGKVGGNNDAPPKEGAPELAPIDEQMRLREEGAARKAAAAEAGALEALVAAMQKHSDNAFLQEWGARALSIITYESNPLRERAKAAGAKMAWLMGLSEGMGLGGIKPAATTSKTGRAPNVPGSGRQQPVAVPATGRPAPRAKRY